MSAGYPFSAVVGMAELRLALLLNAVSPAVGGVLVRGEKGTAKSTVVRALAALLPPVAVVPGCRFSCDPAVPDPDCPDGPHPGGGGAPATASGVPAARAAVEAPAAVGAAADARRGAVGDAAPQPVRWRPARLVELPVGSSEDRLTGSLDLERALAEGVTAFQPGLLAAAHRGVLYVDEVNLLPDHLVDLLLDAAAMGTAHVERDGVSVRHAARFLLVGTMNPEEGELRPQLLDRFGLTVDVAASREPRVRAEVVRRRLAYEADPGGFAAAWAAADAELAERIRAARQLLPQVRLPDAELDRVARVCAAFEVDGLRADLVTARAARAHAAWRGCTEVTAEDVRQAALLALPHRRRRGPFDAPGLDRDKLEEALRDPDPQPPEPPGDGGTPDEEDGDAPDGGAAPGDGDAAQGDGTGGEDGPRAEAGRTPAQTDNPAQGGPGHDRPTPSEPAGHRDADRTDADTAYGAGVGAERVSGVGTPFRPRLLSVAGTGSGTAGRRSRARTAGGRTVGARRPDGRVVRPHLPATLWAAAPHQRRRGRDGAGLRLRPSDLREAVREGREANLVVFVVDASGSMAARQRMTTVKTAVLSLLLDAYQRRDRVAVITFRGARADLVLPPTSSVEVAADRLRALPTGGRTPLAAGLTAAADLLRRERVRDPRRRPLVVAVTDGRATAGRGPTGADPLGPVRAAAAGLRTTLGHAAGSAVVVDCESGPVRLGLAADLAADLGAALLPLAALGSLGGAVPGPTPPTRDSSRGVA